MENQSIRVVTNTERNRNQDNDLHLDRVVASQPEVGPTPPDGGYGWMIVVSAMIYHATVPAVVSMYGLVILNSIREEDHDSLESMKIWDVDLALVPVIAVIIRLLLESWCRALVKIFNMPRFMSLSGLCLTVAGVLLSSYSTDADSNDHIINIFSGIFTGAGCALTGQQTEIIITHYFREKLTIALRIVRMAPTIGNCLVPILVGYLFTVYKGDVVVMIYAAIIMQNCFFLASYTRPVYIEKVIKTTYNMLRDATEEDDEVIYSNQNQNQPGPSSQNVRNVESGQDDDATDVVVFKSKRNAKEIFDPAMESNSVNEARFSTDFTNMFSDDSVPNRFSSDFGALDITSYSRINGYRELENIDRDRNPEPLYRETTVNAPEGSLVFPSEMTPGTARRTASMKKNFITVTNMLMDINFYLYALLNLCTTFSILIMNLVFAPLIWEQNLSFNIWSVAVRIAVSHGAAFCFVILLIALPKTLNEKTRLCAMFCISGSIGFFGITFTSNHSFLVLWCMFASFSTAAASILQQPLYNSTLNDFDTTATITTSNTIVAIFIMVWCLSKNYTYKTCFLTASVLQAVTACVFFAMSFRRRRN